jgi:predicted nucleotidyltransferase component of viral defense system
VIPRANITAWRPQAPWALDEQVEQDLVLSRALSEIFARPALREMLAFRGGTALHKLFFAPPGRYSEDLDLVQVTSGPIKPVLLEVQEALDGWLGQPKSQQASDNSVKLLYGFETTAQPVRRMRVKIEINTREHFAVEGFHHASFAVRSPWYAATTPVTTYVLEELMATKLRALYQRRKGRDLYDLWLALETLSPDEERVVAGLGAYLEHEGLSISRAQYEASMAQKLLSADFRNDVVPLLRDESGYDIDEAYGLVRQRLISRIPGEPWKGLP